MLNKVPAAFGRLCVETRKQAKIALTVRQPPSGGCVLKQFCRQINRHLLQPAAFGRLCVETSAV